MTSKVCVCEAVTSVYSRSGTGEGRERGREMREEGRGGIIIIITGREEMRQGRRKMEG